MAARGCRLRQACYLTRHLPNPHFISETLSMSTIPMVAVLATLLLVVCGSAEAAKILLLIIPSGSHYMSMEQIAIPLLAKGHELHAYINDQCKARQKMADLGVIVHTFNNPEHGCIADNETAMSGHMSSIMSGEGFLSMLSSMKEMDKIFHKELLLFHGDDVVTKELAPVGFDLCIVDGLFQVPHFHIIPYRLNIPVVSLLAVFNPKASGLPLIPSFTPYINMGEFTDEMSFMERVTNTLMYYVLDAVIDNGNPGADSGLITKFAPEKPAITMAELQKKSKLWLVMTDVAIDYPQVRMPHIVDVGGINTRPPKSLPIDFQKLADSAKNGLIIVSFGSLISKIPDNIKQKLLTVFGQIDQTVIWKFAKASTDDIPDNVHAVKWIPQNDLLAHPNTKLFVTHCGANGQFEALYNGVPMLGLPIFGDQVYNSLRMAKKGLGLHRSLVKSTSDELLSAIREILTNNSYQSTMDIHSAMFKDRAMTPVETAVYWIEHVIKYGSDHLLSPALEYPWYKFYCIDVFLFFIFVGVIVLYVAYHVVRLMCRCICNLRGKKVKQQ